MPRLTSPWTVSVSFCTVSGPPAADSQIYCSSSSFFVVKVYLFKNAEVGTSAFAVKEVSKKEEPILFPAGHLDVSAAGHCLGWRRDAQVTSLSRVRLRLFGHAWELENTSKAKRSNSHQAGTETSEGGRGRQSLGRAISAQHQTHPTMDAQPSP